jgi:selenocysteine-specific elongation factor
VIVTLAGHVDHGKTSLVKALTGVDTDRLEEEKRRGLTIDLGFAYTDLAGQRIGFVDVPGHHRFVHNMVAGVAAHQFGLIVVAADDGVMPQTLEHMQILKLIGVERALFALTKIDRCAAERIAVVRADLIQLARTHGFDNAQIIETSVMSGAGIDTLRESLGKAAREQPNICAEGAFRLAIDRAFLIRGSGLVVTGTVHAGTVRLGDELRVAPVGQHVRVRGLHVQDAEADQAQPGDRCAVNITGIERTDVERGHWLVADEVYAPAQSAVVQLSVLDDFPRAVKHWLPVHAYLATGHSAGHVALLESPPLRANDSALVEIEFENAMHPKYGDRVVLRDHARERTIGGGPVVEIAPARAGRRRPARLKQLHDQLNSNPRDALAALLNSTDQGVDLEAFRLLRNLSLSSMADLLADQDIAHIDRAGRSYAYAGPTWRGWQDHAAERIEAYHKTAPHSPGLTVEQLRRVTDVPGTILPELLEGLQAEGRVRQSGGYYQAASFQARLPESEERQLRQFEQLLAEGDQPPSLGDMAKRIGGSLRSLQSAAREFAKSGRIVVVSDTRIFLPQQIRAYSTTVEQLQSDNPEGFSVRQFRDATGIGRNLAIEVLEYFDARGYTRRYDDKRRIVGAQSSLKIA